MQDKQRVIKCLIWDLDNTLWDGVLLENDQVCIPDNIERVLRELDSRGILQSIASRNDHNVAMQKLQEFGVSEYFLHPQINWNSKAASIQTIANCINIGLDTIGFIDDQPFERDEVSYSLPEVFCFDVSDLDHLLERPELTPRFITEDSRMRRLMYQSEIKRKQSEEKFVGTQEEFLATLDMTITISSAREEDLQRAWELTERTNQLNTTGYTYSYDELSSFSRSDHYKLLIAGLEDKYGSYGKIGLTLLECRDQVWTIKLLLMSCRVMSRGVGTIMLYHLLHLAQRMNVRLRAEFVPNGRNRLMYIAYKFAGFKESHKIGKLSILESDLTQRRSFPSYINVQILD